MSIHDCPRCLQLWQAYVTAVARHADLELRQRLAASDNDLPTFKRLEWELGAAKQAAKKAKQLINDHTAKRHPHELRG